MSHSSVVSALSNRLELTVIASFLRTMPKTPSFKRFARPSNYYPDRRRELHNETVFRNLRLDPRLPAILKAHAEEERIRRIVEELTAPEPLVPLD